MNRMAIWVAAASVVLAAAGGRAGDSTPFALDTRTGMRIARETEPIAYSTEWNRGANVQVSVDGVPLIEAVAPSSGVFLWNAAAAGAGTHTLTHTSGGKTLTASFTVLGPPVLRVESAEPAAGSLTLAWDDTGDLPGGTTYAVYRSAADTWTAEDRVATVTGTTWTDNGYWNAEPVLSPLNYWVVADGGGLGERESEPVKTRRRYGLCVGYNAYGGSATAHAQSLADANLCKSLAERAGFAMSLLQNGEARAQDIHDSLIELADKARPGDTVLFYIATHGGVSPSTNNAALTVYDGHYDVARLAADVAEFDSGVGFIGVLMACHSQAIADGSLLSGGQDSWLLKHGLAECKADIAWVTSCGGHENSAHFEELTHTQFGEWFLNQGWKNGYADQHLTGMGYVGGNRDGTNTVLELARYAEVFASGRIATHPAHVYFQNEALLDKTIVATGVLVSATRVPPAPMGLQASQGTRDWSVGLEWNASSGATAYRVYRGDECIAYQCPGTSFYDTWCVGQMTHAYRVRGLNPAGLGPASDPAPGWRQGEGSGEISWEFDISDGRAVIAGIGSAMGTQVIPSNLDGIPVTDIESGAFAGCEDLTSLVFPASVTNIGANAFSGCTGLATLYVPMAWEGTDMLSGAGVPEGCTVAYGVSVAFDAAGGECATESHTYDVGAAFGWLPEAARPGQAFDGWWTGTNGTGTRVMEETPVTAGTDRLFAHWVDPILHVDVSSGDDGNDGLSWQTAKASIQAAIDAAEDGGRILVNDGVYEAISTVDYIRYPDGKQLEIVSVNGAEKTAIDATLTSASRAAYLGNMDYQTGEASGPQGILDGFTIRGGGRASGSSSAGAGAYGGILRRCVVTDNSTHASGGGVAYALCESCIISSNSTAAYGGGAFNCTLLDCTVENNEAACNGGGTAGCRMERCIIRRNASGEYGGAQVRGLAEDCLIEQNEAKLGGGAVAGGWVSRCTVVNNRTEGTGGGAVSTVLHSTILWNNTAEGADDNCNMCHGAYNDTTPLLAGPGNISADPRFRDASAGDYRLSPSSPCLDAGFGPTDLARKDLAGDARWQGRRIDIGAYESSNSFVPSFVAGDLWVDAGNGSDAQSGTSRGEALATIGAAVEKALDGATIHVLPGTYAPFTLEGRILTIQSTDGADRTVVDGGGVAQCAWLGLELTPVLEGFTLANGYVPSGGGAGAYGGTLRGCILRDNTATGGGGGASDARLERCILHGNAALDGLGGGAVFCDLANCLIYGNYAHDTGGGIFIEGHCVENCTIVGNTATATGGGVAGTGCVRNSIVWDNFAPTSPDLQECDEWHVCSSVVKSGCGSITNNPLFADAASGDFRLRADSPCIDAGANDFARGDEDLAGHVRIFGAAVDIGAYEYGSGHLVRLDSRGGTGGTASVIAIPGAAMPDVVVPRKNGYVFGGYFAGMDGTGTQYYTPSGASARNWDGTSATTLHAKWTTAAVPMPVYRFYSAKNKGHFFTISEAEKDNLIATNPNWKYERVAYRAFTNKVAGTVPLYRFYSAKYKGHFYTTSESEKNNLIATNPNWKYERIAYYVYPLKAAGTVAVFRFWSQKYGHHFYTTSEAERDNLIATNPNWKYERVAFYALPPAAEANRAAAGHAAVTDAGSPQAGTSPGVAPRVFTVDDCGVFPLGTCVVELSPDEPTVEELGDREEAEELESPLAVTFRVPEGGVAWQFWSAERGPLAEDTVSSATIALELPDLGLWHWLRFFDEAGGSLSSTWLFPAAAE